MDRIGGTYLGMSEVNKKKVYCLTEDTHTICIGATRCGKTRCNALETLCTLALAGESMILSDPKGELYLYTYPFLERLGYSAMSLPELQYVEVLSVTNSNVKDIENGSQEIKDGESSEKQIATVTLAVKSNQASILAGLNNAAELHVALVSRGNEDAKQQLLKTQDEYFGG